MCMVGHDEIVNGMVRVSLVEKVTFKQSFEKGKEGDMWGCWKKYSREREQWGKCHRRDCACSRGMLGWFVCLV